MVEIIVRCIDYKRLLDMSSVTQLSEVIVKGNFDLVSTTNCVAVRKLHTFVLFKKVVDFILHQ